MPWPRAPAPPSAGGFGCVRALNLSLLRQRGVLSAFGNSSACRARHGNGGTHARGIRRPPSKRPVQGPHARGQARAQQNVSRLFPERRRNARLRPYHVMLTPPALTWRALAMIFGTGRGRAGFVDEQSRFTSAAGTRRPARRAARGAWCRLYDSVTPYSGGATAARLFRIDAGGRHSSVADGSRAEPAAQSASIYLATDRGRGGHRAATHRSVDESSRVAVMDFIERQPLDRYPGGLPGLAKRSAKCWRACKRPRPFRLRALSRHRGQLAGPPCLPHRTVRPARPTYAAIDHPSNRTPSPQSTI